MVDGEEYQIITQDYNSIIDYPENPSKDGYTFIGWDQEYVTVPAADVLFNALFEANEYTITLDNEETIKVRYHESFTLPSRSKEGYKFLGWIDSENNLVDESSFNYLSDQTFEPLYGPLFTITFDTNGGEELDALECHSQLIEELPTPIKDGSAFLGWLLNDELIELPYNNTSESNLILVARWKEVYGDYDYMVLQDNTVEITGYHGEDEEIVIPSMINSKEVTSIGEEAFKNNTTLKKIKLPNTVKEVKDNAFENCSELIELDLNKEIESYGLNLLLGCNKLETLSSALFDGNMMSFFDYDMNNVPNSLSTFILKNTNYTSVSKYFNYFTNDYNVVLDDSWTSIPASMFYNNMQLINIVIPNSVEVIGSNSFRNCQNLDGVLIPNSVTRIEHFAFSSCRSLTSIVIPGSVKYLGSSIFAYCSSLSDLTISNGVEYIDNSAFWYCTALTSVYIPQSVIELGSSSKGNQYATAVSYNIFRGCTNLESVVVDENNPIYDSRNNCNAIIETSTNTLLVGCKSTIIPNTVEIIEANSFNDCLFETINIPNSVTRINGFAFSSCTNLLYINIPDSVIEIGDSSFEYCRKLESIIIPQSVQIIGKACFENYCGLNNVFYNGSRAQWYNIDFGDNNTTLLNSNINIEFDSDVTSLEYITNDNYSYILTNTNSIYEFAIAESNKDIVSFDFSTELLGMDVKTIAKYAFNRCHSLRKIIITNSITRIGYGAFDIYLEDVYYDGSLEQWDNIVIADYNYGLLGANLHAVLFTISFDSMGGNDIDSIKCYSQTIEELPIVVREDCIFLGWLVNDELIELPYDNSSNEDLYLVASWHLPQDDYDYVDHEDYIEITGYHGEDDEIVIPSMINSKEVTMIGQSAFSGNKALKKILLPNTITSIGGFAFSDCVSLTNIIIPGSVVSVGDNAFISCSSLQDVFYPANVDVFYSIIGSNNTSLKNAAFHDSSIEYTITYDLQGGVLNESVPLTYHSGDIIPCGPTKEGYTFVCWDNGNEKLIGELLKYDSNLTLTARFIKGDCVVENDADTIHIYFGSYPQTLVTNDELIAELNMKAGNKPTSTKKYKWSDYNYYISSSITSYMYYQDIDYDNDGEFDYRGVYFTQYRPQYSIGDSIEGNKQDDNGYLTDTIYWFNYDPIEWDVLVEEEYKLLIIANLILDSQDFYPSSSSSTFEHNDGEGYANNYELSNIRKFLNDSFYNTAFNELEKSIISTIEVNNGVTSTGGHSWGYICNNTFDNIFLLSINEVESYYSTTYLRTTKGTDYAKAQGLYELSNGFWWLRTSALNKPDRNYLINYQGNLQYTSVRADDGEVSNTIIGVRPACWINLE